MNRYTTLRPAAVVAALAFTTLSASAGQPAELVSYDILWSGAEYGNTATAYGSVTFDINAMPNATRGGAGGDTHFLDFADGGPVYDFSITIDGASTGNGTYTSDAGQITTLILSFSGLLDYNQELIGQPALTDFNFLGLNPTDPNGLDPFIFEVGGPATPGPLNDVLRVVSITPTPAPSAIALLGLSGLVATRRRR